MLTPSDYGALAEFRYRLRGFLKFSEDAALAAGLEPQQHQALLALKGLPKDREPTIRALAGRLRLRHHSTVELVDRLARRGLLRRKRSPSDRRAVALELTGAGARLLGRLAATHLTELRTEGPKLLASLTALTLEAAT